MTRWSRRALPVALATAALGAVPATAGASITEYTGLSSGMPVEITAGPDGALWFTEQGSPGGVGRITTDGAVTEYPAGSTPGFSGGQQVRDIANGPDGALWFSETSGIGRLDPAAGSVTEYAATGGPAGITAGPDGNLWFTERDASAIGRITPAGVVTDFSAGVTPGSQPTDIAKGADGALWFTEQADPGQIGRIDPVTGVVTEYPNGLTPNGAPASIAANSDGNLLVTEPAGSRVAKVSLNPLAPPTFTEYASGITAGAAPTSIAEGGDGAVWFTEAGSPGRLGRLRSGTVTEYTGGLAVGFTSGNDPAGLTRGPDGNVWFTQRGALPRIARITVPPKVDTGTPKLAPDGRVRIKGDVAPNSQATSYQFHVTSDAGYDQQTALSSAGAGADAQSVSEDLDLPRDATYTVSLAASNGSGDATSNQKAFYLTPDGQIVKEHPPKAPTTSTVTVEQNPSSGDDGQGDEPGVLPPSAPVLGQTIEIAPTRGTVLVRPPGASKFVPLVTGASVAVGSTVDARHGHVRLSTARDTNGTTQAGRFWGSIFLVRQTKAGRGLTDLVLKGGRFAACPTAGAARIASVRKDVGRHSVVRRLWGHDNHGRFRTYGRDSVAAVRGTVWATSDRCDGTVTRVKRGKVLVRNVHTGHTVLLGAGQRYLARHRTTR